MAKVDVIKLKLPTRARKSLLPAVNGVSILALEKRMVPRMRRAMDDWMSSAVRDALKTTNLKRRSGRMQKSLKAGVRVTGVSINSLKGVIRGEPYVVIHEYGGTIRPKQAKALTIPLPAALRADGTPKRRGPRSWKSLGTFVYKSKNGNAYIAYKQKSSGKLILLYLLVDRAKVSARLGLRKALKKRQTELINSFGYIMATEMRQFDLRPGSIKLRVARAQLGRNFRPVRV